MEIELKNIAKICKRHKSYYVILKNINYKFHRKNFYYINSTEGGGKTSLLEIIGLINKPTDGDILIDGKSIKKMSSNEKASIRSKRIGFIFQKVLLNRSLNVRENILLPTYLLPKLKHDDREKLVMDLMHEFKMEDKQDFFPDELSLSERQKVCIIRALVNDPDVIICDDSLNNLSSRSQHVLLEYFKKMAEKGKTIIVSCSDKLPSTYATVNLEIRNNSIIEVKNVRKI